MKTRKSITYDYVRALADGEGGFYASFIQITNTDHELIKSVSEFLNNSGIKTKVYKIKTPNTQKSVYRLAISGFWDLAKYLCRVGFFIDTKHNFLLMYLKRRTEKRKIYNIDDYLYYQKSIGQSKWSIARNLGISLNVLQKREKTGGKWFMSQEQLDILTEIEQINFYDLY